MSTLSDFSPNHTFLLCVDSDGCAFDTMDLKHKECFCPAFIEHFGLQPVARFAREAWEFVNLYGRTRGINRFPALERAAVLLARRREVKERGFTPPSLASLDAYINGGGALTNGAMKNALDTCADAELSRVLRWSEDVNARIQRVVHSVPPFPGVREGLLEAAAEADIVIVSATPEEALRREWRENGLLDQVRLVCGQEQGTKAACIAALLGHYPPGHVLMVGDAPGDLTAARSNGVCFYPIGPTLEAPSWRAFPAAFSAFLRGRYEEAPLAAKFLALLPESPPWEAAP